MPSDPRRWLVLKLFSLFLWGTASSLGASLLCYWLDETQHYGWSAAVMIADLVSIALFVTVFTKNWRLK